jgi:hypothetical protein
MLISTLFQVIIKFRLIEKSINDQSNRHNHRIEIERTAVSGCFELPKFDTEGFATCYRNVTNIIVRFGDRKRDWRTIPTPAILVNCHFDAWPTSFGNLHNYV